MTILVSRVSEIREVVHRVRHSKNIRTAAAIVPAEQTTHTASELIRASSVPQIGVIENERTTLRATRSRQLAVRNRKRSRA